MASLASLLLTLLKTWFSNGQLWLNTTLSLGVVSSDNLGKFGVSSNKPETAFKSLVFIGFPTMGKFAFSPSL